MEWLGVAFGILYVIFAGLQKKSSWWWGLISVSCYVYIFFNEQLYADVILQLFYILITIYGILSWKKKSNEFKNMTAKQHLYFLLEGATISLFILYINTHLQVWFPSFIKAPPSFPLFDSILTGFSIAATKLIAEKKIQNWLWWIIIDLAGASLYIQKELYLTAFLSLLYAFLAIWAYTQWKNLSLK